MQQSICVSVFLSFVGATAPFDEAPVSAVHAVQLASVSDEAASAVRAFASVPIKQRETAGKHLITYGREAAVLLAEVARSTQDMKLRRDCYSLLRHQFPKEPATRELILTQGMNSADFEIRYVSLWHVGEHRVEEARADLFRQMTDRNSEGWFRDVAAKSLGELGDVRALPVLIEACRHDRYMPRHFGNMGLLGLSGKSLNDFGKYSYGEGAFVSGGKEAQMLNPDPLETVTHQAARLTALRDYLKWLQQVRPELYGTLVTEF